MIKLLRPKKGVLQSFLYNLGVSYTKTYLKNNYTTHPYKDSLYGLSSILDNYKIWNQGYRLNNVDEIINLSPPFVAKLGSQFSTISYIDEKRVIYTNDKEKGEMPFSIFKELFSGEVLVAEKKDVSQEPSFWQNLASDIYVFSINTFIILLVISLWCFCAYLSYNYKYSMPFITNSIGIFICSLIVRKQMNIQSKITDKICRVMKRGNCYHVLQSDSAYLFGIISWGTVGISYFTANVLLLAFLPHYINAYMLFNFFCLPYTIWSIVYQKFVIKQWCVLCLIVQCLLWSIFFENVIFYFQWMTVPSLRMAFAISIIYIVVYIAFSQIFDYLMLKKEKDGIEYQYNHLKMKDEVFFAMLQKQKYHEISSEDSQIIFGNPHAHFRMTILTNPHCPPCAELHEQISEFTERYHEDISIQYIFTSFNEELMDHNRYLIAVYNTYSQEECARIYKEWYAGGKNSADRFIKRYPVEMFDILVENENKKHISWKEKNMQDATPAIFINGYELPLGYRIEDVIHFVKSYI